MKNHTYFMQQERFPEQGKFFYVPDTVFRNPRPQNEEDGRPYGHRPFLGFCTVIILFA